jgi:hypothetical protein
MQNQGFLTDRVVSFLYNCCVFKVFHKGIILMYKSSRNRQEKGQGLINYVLILMLVVAVVVIGGVFITINDSHSAGGGRGGVAAAPALVWGIDDIYNKAEACSVAGVPSGGMIYLWTENVPMQNGDAFYWTGSRTAPVPGYYLMNSMVCP